MMYLVDLPGYGFAKAPKSAVETWTRLMKSFLRGRVSLRRAYLLIDSRHGIKPVDQDMMGMLTASGVSSLLVLTKGDKIKAGAAAAVTQATQRSIKRYAAIHPEPLLTSSETGVGMERLRADVARFLD
jgi:GTP-binding protein